MPLGLNHLISVYLGVATESQIMPGTNPPHFPAEDSIWANQQDLDYNLDFTYQNAARRYATHCQPYVTPTPAEQVAEERQSSDLFPTITNYVPYSCPFGHQDVYSSSYQPELNVSQGFDLYEQPVRQHLVPVSTGQSYARTLVRPFALTTSDASVQMGASKFVDPRNGLEYNFAPRPESRPNSARVAQPPLQQIQTTPLNSVQTEPKRIVRKFAQTWTETQRVRAAPSVIYLQLTLQDKAPHSSTPNRRISMDRKRVDLFNVLREESLQLLLARTTLRRSQRLLKKDHLFRPQFRFPRNKSLFGSR
ncbi:hypothetical protein L596_014552 [Steinernema carpocapsae]|uniref:Uncharacterized protein n=1 Tax=Steinernema carpocapsae TaxID=34508 RepID=A0A4U5ND12_STECR|nr:hypothetical protein L596_014552 [Steinernema carpocapsae]